MPIYNYRCAACGSEFERLVRSDTKVSCPDCQGRKLERLLSLTARPAGAKEARRLQPPRPPTGRRVLRRRMSLAQPLSPRLDGLRERLAGHRPVTGGEDESLLWAAVAVILVPSPDAVLLIRRAERPGDPWSGHMALPGGRREEVDADLVGTAVRETFEEVGLTLARTDLLGSLDDVVPRTPVLPPIAVRPYVFSLPERPPLVPNPEVAATRWVHLDHLLHPEDPPLSACPPRYPRGTPRGSGVPVGRGNCLGNERSHLTVAACCRSGIAPVRASGRTASAGVGVHGFGGGWHSRRSLQAAVGVRLGGEPGLTLPLEVPAPAGARRSDARAFPVHLVRGRAPFLYPRGTAARPRPQRGARGLGAGGGRRGSVRPSDLFRDGRPRAACSDRRDPRPPRASLRTHTRNIPVRLDIRQDSPDN